MKFAVLADIHGNLPALNAVLSDMDRLGIEKAVNLGDHLSGPLLAKETADALMALDFPSICGNHDRALYTLHPKDMGESDRVAFEQLEQHHLNWLKGLPATMNPYDNVFICHGTPSSDSVYWLEVVNSDGRVCLASTNFIESQAKTISASLFLCGHTHIPRIVSLPNNQLIVNPGSVGLPAYDDDTPVYHTMETANKNASYAIVEKLVGHWHTTIRSVPYDASEMIRLAQMRGRNDWANALATGKIA